MTASTLSPRVKSAGYWVCEACGGINADDWQRCFECDAERPAPLPAPEPPEAAA